MGQPSSTFARIQKIYGTLALLVFNTLILLVLIEACSTIVLRIQKGDTPPLEQRVQDFIDRQVASGYYRQQEWARPYWEEHMQVADNWAYHPYSLWRTRPFDGDYIKINEGGIRQVPGADCTGSSYRIFMFGGSTLWGYGSPDWGTIPAYLQEALSASHPEVCITNYADVAYNSTQSIITLLEQLQNGNVPDMVIFYDGANEVTTANITGKAGGHFYQAVISSVVSGSLVEQLDKSSSLSDVLRDTATYRLVVGETAGPERVYAPYSDALADSVVQVYFANYEAVISMANAYNFKFIAFWQPVLAIREGSPNDEEQRFLWEMPGGLPELFHGVYARIAASADDKKVLHNLADALDDHHEGGIWIDFNHLTPAGNQIVANTILPIIMDQLDGSE